MAASEVTPRGFPSPFDVPVPAACDGWEELYPYYFPFREDRGALDGSRFWFQEGLHAPEPLYPFDTVVYSSAVTALNQASARLFVVPPSLGVEARMLNGYVYVSANSVTDEATLARRAELFTKRGGYYYEHWDELYGRWVEKVEASTGELQALEVPELPEFEDETVVIEGSGIGSSHRLLLAYDRLLEGLDRIFQYHFEFLNLGYGAYLVFYELCRNAFPDISDQTIAAMVSGIDVLVLRPDDELKRLARRAVELGVADRVREAAGEDELRTALTGSEPGAQWLADWEQTKDPWFYFSCGIGVFYHHHRSWVDDAAIPLATIAFYIERLEAGDDIVRPYEAVRAERERITGAYRDLLPEETRRAFDDRLALARTGVTASPGVIEGRARVILRVDDLGLITDGEILVAPTTSTSWTPVFGKIAAAVLDIGGIMCHAVIVAREYGLPAVVGTGTATKQIKTGDHLRVDADAGIVTVLART